MRIKNIILYPKEEWAFIAAGEEPEPLSVFLGVALPQLLFFSVILFFGYTFIWGGDFSTIASLNNNSTIPNHVIPDQETVNLGVGIYFAFQTLLMGALGVW